MVSWDISNPRDRAIVTVARSWGVSPSRFMGESKPQQVTTLPNGDSIVSTVAEWTMDDRQAAMDLAIYESELCSGCGHPLSETTDQDNQFAYVAKMPPIQCHRCEASEAAQEVINKVYEKQHPGSKFVQIVKREEVTDASNTDR